MFFQLQNFKKIISPDKVTHHTRHIQIRRSVQLNKLCIFYARIFKFRKIFFRSPLKIRITQQKQTVRIIYVIIKHVAQKDVLRLFIVCKVIKFHFRILKSGCFIVIETVKDISVHLFRTGILFVTAVALCITEEPFFLKVIQHRFVKFQLGIRVVVCLKKHISLPIE